jgi:pimeloyl-ACP methyl ester carboxylesterase
LTVGAQRISVLEFQASGNGGCLSLHGGGSSSKETSRYLADTFLARGLSFSSFDFSGQGTSGGSLQNASLNRRAVEAMTVLQALKFKTTVLMGSSMGGAIALRLTAETDVGSLILFCPAAYSRRAWGLDFGRGFTEELRREDSYLETDAGELCARYRGNVLLVFGSEDDVIPEPVVRLYSEGFTNAKRFRKVVLEGCPHPIHRWIQDQPAARRQLENELSEFLAYRRS